MSRNERGKMIPWVLKRLRHWERTESWKSERESEDVGETAVGRLKGTRGDVGIGNV